MPKQNFASIELNKKSSNQDQARGDLIKRIFDSLIYSAVAYLFSVLWFKQVTQSLYLNFTPTYMWEIKLIILIVFAVFVNLPRLARLAILGLVFIVAAAGILFRSSFGAPIYEFYTINSSALVESYKWLTASGQHLPEALPRYLAYGSILFSLFLIYIKPMPIILTLIWLIPYLVAFQNSLSSFSLLYFLAGLACVLVTFARQSNFSSTWRKTWQMPPIFLIAIILVVIFFLQSFIPTDIFYNSKINRMLDQAIKSKQNMPDTVRYFEFSIKDVGFYPQDVHLGGPVEKQNQPFMRVTGPNRPIYLRGAIFNEFEKNIWHASPMTENFLFYNEDPIKQQLAAFQNRSKDTNEDPSFDRYFSPADIIIEPIFTPIQAVFHAGKPEQITSLARDQQVTGPGADPLRFYFNTDGQIYASRQIGLDGYLVKGQMVNLAANPKYLQDLVSDTEAGLVHFSEQKLINKRDYKDFLIEHEPNLANLINDPSLGQAGKLKAIIDYLANNFSYDLSVAEISDDQDLFEDFILNHKGYCTYFATALTILARQAGFEARYVEGFLVPGMIKQNIASKDYQRLVTSDQAHAWTEIKTEELGWLAFDATPDGSLDELSRDREEEEQEEAEQNKNPTQPSSKPTNPPHVTTSPAAKVSEKENQDQVVRGYIIPQWLLIIAAISALLALAIVFCLVRLKHLKNRHDISWLSDKFSGENKEIITYIWLDLKNLYALQDGRDIATGQTILMAIRQMQQTFNWKPDLTFQAYEAIEAALYAENEVAENQIKALLSIYQQAENICKLRTPKFKWFFSRFLFGSEPDL